MATPLIAQGGLIFFRSILGGVSDFFENLHDALPRQNRCCAQKCAHFRAGELAYDVMEMSFTEVGIDFRRSYRLVSYFPQQGRMQIEQEIRDKYDPPCVKARFPFSPINASPAYFLPNANSKPGCACNSRLTCMPRKSSLTSGLPLSHDFRNALSSRFRMNSFL